METFASNAVLAVVSGGELTIIGLASVFTSLIGLVVVVHAFNWWDAYQTRKEAPAGAGSAGGSGQEAAPSVPTADPDVDPGVAVAISLALALASQTTSAGVPYQVDGAPEGGPISGWRMAARPGGPSRGGW